MDQRCKNEKSPCLALGYAALDEAFPPGVADVDLKMVERCALKALRTDGRGLAPEIILASMLDAVRLSGMPSSRCEQMMKLIRKLATTVDTLSVRLN